VQRNFDSFYSLSCVALAVTFQVLFNADIVKRKTESSEAETV